MARLGTFIARLNLENSSSISVSRLAESAGCPYVLMKISLFLFYFQVTHDEASHCLLPFFERFLDLEKLSELNPKMAIIIEKTMTDFFNEQVESFVEELEEIALDPEVTFDHDGDYTGTLSQEDSVIPTGPRTLNHDQEDPIGDSTEPRAPTPLKEERDL